ncbi:unnamed protein product, partial [Rotaria sp. Silwood1]
KYSCKDFEYSNFPNKDSSFTLVQLIRVSSLVKLCITLCNAS